MAPVGQMLMQATHLPHCSFSTGASSGSGRLSSSSQKEEGARRLVEQQRVLAHPAEAGFGRQQPLQNGGRVDEGAPAQRLAALLDALPSCLSRLRSSLVVAPEGIAADVAEGGVAQGSGKARLERQIVHPHRQHPQGARQQLVGRARIMPWRAM